MLILAMDLGKSNSVACIYDSMDGRHEFRTIRTSAQHMHDLIIEQEPDRVVIEICPTAGWVCDLCRVLDVEVEVANPNHEAWRWKRVKTKSDRADALKLAQLSVMNQLPTVYVPQPDVRAWRALINHRQMLVRRRTAVKNSIRAVLVRQGIDWPAGQAGWTKACLYRLREMAGPGDQEMWRVILASELDQLRSAETAVTRIEEELNAIALSDDRVALLQTIPGVGRRLAETVVAIIDDPHRFACGKQVGAYAGLAPRRYQSGAMDRSGRISRRGSTLLRSLLVEVSWLGRQYNPWMKAVYERALRGTASRKKIAIVALARRLLVVCWAMLRDGTKWKEPAALRLAA
jgi:transposase